jgi:o-succinylbenzoate synthase
MRIDCIELIHIKMDLVSPFVTTMGTEYDEEHIIVRVDGEGVTGWGESVAEGTPFYSYWHGGMLESGIAVDVKPKA